MSTIDVSTDNNILPVAKLYSLAAENAESYRNASPYAHAVFDDVFDPSMLHAVLKEFEAEQKQEWREFDNKFEKKLQLSADKSLGPSTRALIHNLNSGTFLKFLEELTGIPKLVADPYLVGGG